jgi:C4-dicarboxylate transporter DctM subunit
MSDTVIGLGGIVVLIASILGGVHIVLALGLVGTLGVVMIAGPRAAFSILSTTYFSFTHSYHFSCITMFVLMGGFAISAGIGKDTFDAATKWIGRWKGGLAIGTIVSSAVFGAATGTSVGTAALFSRLARPEILRQGYVKAIASASVAIAGTLAMMIPPSALMVVYAILTDQSIGALLIAGVIPGFTYALILSITTFIWVWKNPKIAPIVEQRFSLKEKLYALRLTGPLIICIICIIGGLYAGVFTPTEAGAAGAMTTLILAVIKKRGFRGINLLQALLETIKTASMVFLIITSAIVFSKFMSLSGIVTLLGDTITTWEMNRWFVWVIVICLYLLLGMILDAPSMLAVSLPITLPIMTNLGFNPVWFGVCVVLLAEIGLITPPVGVNCFVVAGAAKEYVDLNDVFRGVLPYALAGVFMLVILSVFPDLALWLPRRMGLE